jgi:[ribosomal protein S5]-alanine N-acetyltransferase
VNESGRVVTERLVLRPPAIEDGDAIASLMSPDVTRWLASWPAAVDRDIASRRIAEAQTEMSAGRAMHWLAERRNAGDVVGWIRITRSETQPASGELGFWLGAAFHGQGLATEAVRAGFDDLGLTRIEGGAQLKNDASQRVMQRIGTRPSDQREVWASARLRHETCIYYVMTRDEMSATANPSVAR